MFAIHDDSLPESRTAIRSRRGGCQPAQLPAERESQRASRLTLEASGLVNASAWATGIAGGVASNSRSRIEPRISIEAKSGVAADAAHAGSPSIGAGVAPTAGERSGSGAAVATCTTR